VRSAGGLCWRESGGQDAVVQAGQDHGDVQSGVGDLVAVGWGDLGDQLVAAQPPQVISGLPGGDSRDIAQLRGELADVAAGEPGWVEPEDEQRGEQRVAAGGGDGQAGDAGPAAGGDGLGDGVEGGGAGDRVVAELLEAQQAPVGGEADLPQRGQVRQPFADPEVNCGGR